MGGKFHVALYISTLMLCTVLFIKATLVCSLHADIHIVTGRGAVEQTILMHTFSSPTKSDRCLVLFFKVVNSAFIILIIFYIIDVLVYLQSKNKTLIKNKITKSEFM